MKKIIIVVAVLILLTGGFFVLNNYIYEEKREGGQNNTPVENNTLENTDWEWVRSTLIDGRVITAPENKFILTLKDGKVTSKTDCNSMAGEYVRDGEVLSFTPFAMTKMYCEGSQESEYARELSLTTSYSVTGNELRINLNRDAGVMIFRKLGSKSEVSENNIKIYFYDSKLDQGVGGARCDSKSVTGVLRNIPKTQTPLKDSINLLLKGEVSNAEKEAGLTTEFPLSGFALKNAKIENGVAVLEFVDPESKTSGGSCRVSILRGQIEATAKQFLEVKSVKILPEEILQP